MPFSFLKKPLLPAPEPSVDPKEYSVLKSYVLNSIASWNKGLKAQTFYDKKVNGKTESGAPRRKMLIKAALNDVANMPDIENYTAKDALKNSFGVASSAVSSSASNLWNSAKSKSQTMFSKKSQGGKKTRKNRKNKK